MRQWILAAATLAAAMGCSDGAPLNLGSNEASAPEASAPEASAPTIAGNWTGYIELQTLDDGSDVIALGFTQRADGSYDGTVTFGTRPPPPPPDPDAGYLPGVDLFDAGPV